MPRNTQTGDKSGSGETFNRYAGSDEAEIILLRHLRREGTLQAEEEGKPREAFIAPIIMASASVMLRAAIDHANNLPWMMPDHPDFDTQCALRRVVKDQIADMAQEIVNEARL